MRPSAKKSLNEDDKIAFKVSKNSRVFYFLGTFFLAGPRGVGTAFVVFVVDNKQRFKKIV
jgi:hypothetical protein